jgi:hypothetical protein
MSFTRKLKKYFEKNTSRNYEKLINKNIYNEESFKAAGCVFTDGKLLLAGYQPRKRKPFISGLGGKKEEGENYLDTAIRETIEELFEFKSIPKELILEIKNIAPIKIIQNGSYIIVVYTFNDLDMFLKIMSKYNLRSILYDSMPKNITELIFNRKTTYNTNNIFYKPEVSHLAILPLVEHSKNNPYVDPYFIEDMPILMK